MIFQVSDCVWSGVCSHSRLLVHWKKEAHKSLLPHRAGHLWARRSSARKGINPKLCHGAGVVEDLLGGTFRHRNFAVQDRAVFVFFLGSPGFIELPETDVASAAGGAGFERIAKHDR